MTNNYLKVVFQNRMEATFFFNSQDREGVLSAYTKAQAMAAEIMRLGIPKPSAAPRIVAWLPCGIPSIRAVGSVMDGDIIESNQDKD